MASGVLRFFPILMPQMPLKDEARTLDVRRSNPSLLNPIRLISARSSANRNKWDGLHKVVHHRSPASLV